MNKTLFRKVIYLLAMAVCLVPLYAISAPSFVRPDGGRSEGGWLTRLREENYLSQANLGEIDPASESMKLATLGMRGVAANLLWNQANTYKKKEQWDNLRATLNQIAKLQPNFISVWQHQAWNLSYNVSVEFDNYEHRYHWVKKGIDFLMEGTRYNRSEPRLLWDLGWFFGHKFGRSDETKQFRRKYNTDDDFHNTFADKIAIEDARNYRGQPDNWLTAHQWFSQAQRVVDLNEAPIKGKNPLVFHSDPGKALIRYAEAIEEEGVFDEVARIAWQKADSRWKKYGDRPIPTSYGYTILLDSGERQTEKVKQLEADLLAMVPGGEATILDKKRASLTEEEQRLLEADLAELDTEDYQTALQAKSKLLVTPEDMVEAVAPEDRNTARVTASKLVEARAYETTIRRYRDVVNYVYWKTRCEVEQQDRAIEGRQFLYEANEAFEDIRLVESIEKYDEAWERWSSIHRDYQVLADDVTAEDLVDAIKRYQGLLDQLGQPFPPEGFPMLRLMANYADQFPDIGADKLEQMADEYEASLNAEAESNTPSSDDDAEPADNVAGAEVPSSESTTVSETDSPAVDDASDESKTLDTGDDDSEPAAPAEADAEPSDLSSRGGDEPKTEPAETGEASAAKSEPETSVDAQEESSEEESSKEESSITAAEDAADNAEPSAGFLKSLDDAYELYLDADLQAAREKYESTWARLADNGGINGEAEYSDAEKSRLLKEIGNYEALLGQLDSELPEDFPLREFWESSKSEN